MEKGYKKLEFKNGKDIDLLLDNISGKNDSKTEKMLPYKDGYGTILLFKYNNQNKDVYKMMNFIQKDLAYFIPENDICPKRAFDSEQIHCLNSFMEIARKEDLMDDLVCKKIWEMLNKTFNFNCHQRFSKNEVHLFRMCCDFVQQRLKKEYGYLM